jgi:S-adenosylhomocysteine hydrolase
MKLDKQFVLDEIAKAGHSEKVQQAVHELPDKIDHEQHAAMLQRFGVDPGKLAERAAERGLASL